MIHGIINIYKNWATHPTMVAKLRGILKQKKIGHAGTLDPEAEGISARMSQKNAQKLCDMLTDKRKTYRAVMLLGNRNRYAGYYRYDPPKEGYVRPE